MTIPVIAIVGSSNSGKTRVATALIKILASKGYRIAAVKHCPHGHQVDRPASDSARLFAAGAAQVFLSSPGQKTSIERTDRDLTLEEIVAYVDPSYDLVIAEGFKGSHAPKVLVLGAQELPVPENVIATVGDKEIVEDVPCYSFHELDGLADQVQNQVMSGASDSQSISIAVDGVPISMTSFPSKALKGVTANPKSVRIVMNSAQQHTNDQKAPSDLPGVSPSRRLKAVDK